MVRRPIKGESEATPTAFCVAVLKELDRVGVKPGQRFSLAFYEEPELLELQSQNGLKFVKDSQTSRAAAIANYPRKDTQRHRILAFIWRRGDKGATRAEIHEDLAMTYGSVNPRVVELIQAGYVEETQQTRKTQTKSDAAVLALTPRGKDAVEDDPFVE